MSYHRGVGGGTTPNAQIPLNHHHHHHHHQLSSTTTTTTTTPSTNHQPFLVQSPSPIAATNAPSSSSGSYFQKPPSVNNPLLSNDYLHHSSPNQAFHHQNHYHSHPHPHPHPSPDHPPLASPQLVDTFDPGFQVPSTEGLGLLPMPVPYEDFQYSFPTPPAQLQVQPSAGASGSSSSAMQHCTAGFQNQTYHSLTYPQPQNHHHHHHPQHPQNHQQHRQNQGSGTSFSNDWNISPISPAARTPVARLPPSSVNHSPQMTLSDLLNSTNQQAISQMPISYHHYQQPQHHQQQPIQTPGSLSLPSGLSSNPSLFAAPSTLRSPPRPTEPETNQSSDKPPTPPPLFDASEKDLLSSFLNIFGDSNGEWDFDPQGMPEGMPVLGALRRRLEASPEVPTDNWLGKLEADEMGREVESRLKLEDAEPGFGGTTNLPPRPPASQRTPTQADCISLPMSPQQTEDEPVGRKKVKTHARPYPSLISTTAHPVGTADQDVEMTHLKNDHISNLTGLPPPLASSSLVGAPQPQPSSSSSSSSMFFISNDIPKPSGDSVSNLPSQNNETDDLSPANDEGERTNRSQLISFRPGISNKTSEAPIMHEPNQEDSKKNKSTHIASEQRRRSAIQGGFGNLVEILKAGESLSGISIASPEVPSESMMGSGVPKPTTRGRGRRGEIETGASKSVVLERAAEYVKWMYTGNVALRMEVERIENVLKSNGLDI